MATVLSCGRGRCTPQPSSKGGNTPSHRTVWGPWGRKRPGSPPTVPCTAWGRTLSLLPPLPSRGTQPAPRGHHTRTCTASSPRRRAASSPGAAWPFGARPRSRPPWGRLRPLHGEENTVTAMSNVPLTPHQAPLHAPRPPLAQGPLLPHQREAPSSDAHRSERAMGASIPLVT